MTNREWYSGWITDTVNGFDDDEFCRFLVAFQSGYTDTEHELTCTMVCGHEPGPDCDDCAGRTQAYIRKEHADA